MWTGVSDGGGGEETVRDEPADGWSYDPRQVANHAQYTETFLPLIFRQDIRDHRVMCGMRNTREQANDNHQRIQGVEIVDKTKRQCADSDENKPEQDKLFAPELIGQRAADG